MSITLSNVSRVTCDEAHPHIIVFSSDISDRLQQIRKGPSRTHVPPVGVDVLAEQRHLPVAASPLESISGRISSGVRDCSTPRVFGTTQYVHRSLQPWATLTHATTSDDLREVVEPPWSKAP